MNICTELASKAGGEADGRACAGGGKREELFVAGRGVVGCLRGKDDLATVGGECAGAHGGGNAVELRGRGGSSGIHEPGCTGRAEIGGFVGRFSEDEQAACCGGPDGALDVGRYGGGFETAV